MIPVSGEASQAKTGHPARSEARRGTAMILSLKTENDRLGRLLGVIDGGRWWTRESPDPLGVDSLTDHVAAIRAAIDAIEVQVGHLGGR